MERYAAEGLAGSCSGEVVAVAPARLGATGGSRVRGHRGPACQGYARGREAVREEGSVAETHETEALRRVGPGFSAPDDASWHDDGYERSEDEFFESPSLGRGIFVVVFAVVVLCLYMIASGRA